MMMSLSFYSGATRHTVGADSQGVETIAQKGSIYFSLG